MIDYIHSNDTRWYLDTYIQANGDPYKPTPYEAAIMAKNAYFDTDQELAGEWRRSKRKFLYVDFEDTRSTFKSVLYEKKVGHKLAFVYVNRGTVPTLPTSWYSDIQQLWGESKQYRESIKNANRLYKQIIRRHLGVELTFVGHSLGGGEAVADALETGGEAIVFNPAWLSDATRNTIIPLNKRKPKIDAYIVQGEMVSYLQDRNPLGILGLKIRPDGAQHTLPATYPSFNPSPIFGVTDWEASAEITIYSKEVIQQRINNHLMEAVLARVQRY